MKQVSVVYITWADHEWLVCVFSSTYKPTARADVNRDTTAIYDIITFMLQ